MDYKLFRAGSALAPNTLVIGEQVPGYYVVADQTSFLSQNTYWASYNVPFYPFIWNVSGYPAMYERNGNVRKPCCLATHSLCTGLLVVHVCTCPDLPPRPRQGCERDHPFVACLSLRRGAGGRLWTWPR